MMFGGYQAFPTNLWKQEFILARERQLQHIEWVVDSPQFSHNPILSNPTSIQEQIDRTGVNVISVCADFLMDAPLDLDVPESWKPFNLLLDSMEILDVRLLVVPCVDQSSLSSQASLRRLSRAVREVGERLSQTEIRVALETDLAPKPFGQLMDELDPSVFGVNYDIGNSASLGFDPREEFEMYGSRINLVHVKDRQLHGGSVQLGMGATDFRAVLSGLLELRFNGPVTLQCFRDYGGVSVFDDQLAFYQALVQEILRGS